MNFLIGGGSHAERTCINLIVDGKVERTAVGKDNEKLEWRFWNVDRLQGKEAKIEIVDRASGGWGHINIDQIELADKARSGHSGPIEQMVDFGSMVLAYGGECTPSRSLAGELPELGEWAGELKSGEDLSYPAIDKLSTAVSTPGVSIGAGEAHKFTFGLT